MHDLKSLKHFGISRNLAIKRFRTAVDMQPLTERSVTQINWLSDMMVRKLYYPTLRKPTLATLRTTSSSKAKKRRDPK